MCKYVYGATFQSQEIVLMERQFWEGWGTTHVKWINLISKQKTKRKLQEKFVPVYIKQYQHFQRVTT